MCVLMEVLEDCDFGHYYILADSTYTSEGKVSNKLRQSYRFEGRYEKFV